ncbi:MAG: methyltransferase [Alphaproteobacteria bacterium]|nr:methyltransferase [Alphaproteobacteria bacterium]
MTKNKDIIHVLDKKIALKQAPQGFRTSLDSVMLAAACPARSGQSILDLGCGVGSAGLCALWRINGATLTGIDIQSCHIDLALENAVLNNMTERCRFMQGDIRTLDIDKANHIICNPPYQESGKHLHSPSNAKAKAMGHTEDDISLQDWITCAFNHIKGQGSLTLIHEAGRLDDILHALYSKNGGKRFGNVEIFPLWPKESTPAKRVIVRAWKHKKSPAIMHNGLILHNEDGSYTKTTDRILRDGKALF